MLCSAAVWGGQLTVRRFDFDQAHAPVVSRFRTYDVKLNGALRDYADRIWALPAVAEWREAALAEKEEIEELEVEF